MSLDNMLKKLSVRSPWLFRINAGSCNGCDVELPTPPFFPRYAVERLGFPSCASPGPRPFLKALCWPGPSG